MPMVSRNSTGSNQEVVVIASTAKITTTPAAMIIGISREILSSRVLFSMAGPAVMALLPQQFLHGIDGFIGAGVRIPVGEDHIHDGAVVLVVVGDVPTVRKDSGR